MFLKRILLVIPFIGLSHFSFAQEKWPADVSQLYLQARDYLASGELQQAIVTYKQAINKMPGNMLLYRDLAKTYYAAHLYEDAENTLKPLLKSKDGDEQCYQVMAMCQVAENEDKKGRHTLEDGIKRFPASGLLYHELGKWYEAKNDPEKALSEWLEGIAQDPQYYLNYYEAASMYAHTNHPVWTIVYGETFVNMERETPRSYDTRKMIFDAYRKLYAGILTEVPQYGTNAAGVHTFEDAVKDVYRQLSPYVKDGINMESLLAVRSLFLTEWQKKYSERYPYTLFQYEDTLMEGDYFDLYDEWLLGKAVDEKSYTNWKAQHTGALDALGNWFASHPLQPEKRDVYGSKDTKGLFPKPKE